MSKSSNRETALQTARWKWGRGKWGEMRCRGKWGQLLTLDTLAKCSRSLQIHRSCQESGDDTNSPPLAAVCSIAMGTASPSVIRCRLEPFFPRSVGVLTGFRPPKNGAHRATVDGRLTNRLHRPYPIRPTRYARIKTLDIGRTDVDSET